MIRMNGQFSGFRGPALLFGLMLAACIPTRKEDVRAGSGTELGNVVGSIFTADNRPAVGLTVTLYPESQESASVRTAVTDAEGEYAFQDVIGNYSLFALDGAGNGLKVDSIHAGIADSIDLERLNLAPVASVSGYCKVIGVRSAEPKVLMYLYNPPSPFEFDPNTSFLLSDLPAGKYWLNISYDWSRGIAIPITLAPGETLDLDTITLVNQYSAGIGFRDTLKVSASQLPLRLEDKLAPDITEVDSVLWVLNGERINSDHADRHMSLTLEAGSLRDTGNNVLEMRLYLPDTTVFRTWHIDFDDGTVTPWSRHAVKAIFKGSEANLRADNDGKELGIFQILERRSLLEAELAFWNWSPVGGADSSLPEIIKIPMNRYEFGNPYDCGDMSYNMEPDLFTGDTVTFMTEPNKYYGGMSFRIRKNEDFSDFGNLAWFDEASWPLAGFHRENRGTRDIRLGAGTLNVRLNLNLPAKNGRGDWGCLPLSRGFAIGADRIPHEYVAMPAGMSPGNLLIHFRAGLPNGLFTEAVADSGDYVFLDSSGHGVAGRDKDRREVQLSASEVDELKTLLAPLPAVIPIEWDKDYLENNLKKEILDHAPLMRSTNYLLSGGRGCILAGEPRSRPAPEAKLNLFHSVETWLRSHGLL